MACHARRDILIEDNVAANGKNVGVSYPRRQYMGVCFSSFRFVRCVI
jgi:hypothetical protein